MSSVAALDTKKISLSKPGVALILASVLMLPLWLAWAAALGTKPHYEFFPILVLGVAFLVRQRLQEVDESALRPGNPVLAAAMALFSIPCLFVGYFQPMAVLASAGTISAFTMVVYLLGGWGLVRKISPAFLLLLVITPPPGDLDIVLTTRLQRLSVVIASRTLDMFDIYHVVNQNTLEVDGQRFLVEEACSGIQSLFSILAFTLFYAIWNHRGFWRTGLLLAGAISFDLSLNVFRICLGVIAKITGDIDLLNGWPAPSSSRSPKSGPCSSVPFRPSKGPGFVPQRPPCATRPPWPSRRPRPSRSSRHARPWWLCCWSGAF